MKGIILAGGSGTRLFPSTQIVCKQLLPIYDKPMIYYPLSVLMLSGIREILIISTPQDTPFFEKIFGDGTHLGLHISYKIQDSPEGIAQAFLLGEEFIGDDAVTLILGDNIFYGDNLGSILSDSIKDLETHKAKIFAYFVQDPTAYGVVAFDENKKIVSIEEKPQFPKSNFAVTGLYMYTNSVVEYTKKITPSARGELEITTLNQMYLEENSLAITLLGRGFAWLDTGTHDTLLDSANFIATIEKRQGLKIAAVEEIAYNMQYIDKTQLLTLAKKLEKSSYGQYLLRIAHA